MINFFKEIIYRPLFNVLVFFAWLVPGHSIGWAIIILTVVIRLALWHTSVAALRAPIELRQHQDELKAIQERHKDDRNAQAQAQMAFYKERGINPLGGCLPLLIQFPILIILYAVFRAGLGSTLPHGILYSYMPHITSLNPSFFGINLGKPDKYFVLPAMAALLQYFQTKDLQFKQFGDMKNIKSDDPTALMNKQMVYLAPVMIFIVAYRLAAGLSLYYIVTTLIAWLQQYYVFKTYRPKTAASVTVRSKKAKSN